MKIFSSVLALVVLLCAVAPVSAQSSPDDAWTGVTVLVGDGWRYRDVSVSLDPHGAGLWILRADGAERLISVDAVTQIVNGRGEDVTRRVLDGEPAPTRAVPNARAFAPQADRTPEPGSAEPGWDGTYDPASEVVRREPRRRMTQASPLPFKMALSLEGGAGLPAGDWYSEMEASYAFGARLRIATRERSYIAIGFRRQDLGLETSVYDYAYDGYTVVSMDVDAHVNMYEVTFGHLSTPAGVRATSTYIEVGAAYQNNVAEVSYGGSSVSASEDSGAFLLRCGALIPIGTGSSVDFGASWAYKGLVFSESNEAEGSILGIHLGLVWRN